MNPDIAIPVLVAVLFLAATLAFVVLDRREERKYEPRHHHPAGPRHAFADDRDVTDPDGDQFVDELHHDWWRESAPSPARLADAHGRRVRPDRRRVRGEVRAGRQTERPARNPRGVTGVR